MGFIHHKSQNKLKPSKIETQVSKFQILDLGQNNDS